MDERKLCKHRDKKVYPFDRCETFTSGRNECNKCRGALQTYRSSTKIQELETNLLNVTRERDLLQAKLDQSLLKELPTQANLAEEQLLLQERHVLLITTHETTLKEQEGEIARLKLSYDECSAMLAARETILESMTRDYQDLSNKLCGIQAERNDELVVYRSLQEKYNEVQLRVARLAEALLENHLKEHRTAQEDLNNILRSSTASLSSLSFDEHSNMMSPKPKKSVVAKDDPKGVCARRTVPAAVKCDVCGLGKRSSTTRKFKNFCMCVEELALLENLSSSLH